MVEGYILHIGNKKKINIFDLSVKAWSSEILEAIHEHK